MFLQTENISYPTRKSKLPGKPLKQGLIHTRHSQKLRVSQRRRPRSQKVCAARSKPSHQSQPRAGTTQQVPVTIKFWIVYAVPVLLIVAAPACAASAPTTHDNYGIPAKWFACVTSEDCGKVSTGCGVVVTAVNKERVSSAALLVCKNAPRDCTKACLAYVPDNTFVLCENHQCILKTP